MNAWVLASQNSVMEAYPSRRASCNRLRRSEGAAVVAMATTEIHSAQLAESRSDSLLAAPTSRHS